MCSTSTSTNKACFYSASSQPPLPIRIWQQFFPSDSDETSDGGHFSTATVLSGALAASLLTRILARRNKTHKTEF